MKRPGRSAQRQDQGRDDVWAWAPVGPHRTAPPAPDAPAPAPKAVTPAPKAAKGPPPAPAHKSPPPRGRVVAVAVLIAVVGLIGVAVAALDRAADRDADGTITRPVDLPAAELRVGDCFDDPGPQEEVFAIRAVPCEGPHGNEVYHAFAHPDSVLPPSQQAAFQRIDEQCVPAFESFVGTAYETSTLEFFTFEPTLEGWDQGDRTVQCVIRTRDGSALTGSAQGSAR